MPGQVSHAATGSVAAANLTGARVGGVHGSELVAAAHSAFATSMSVGMRVAAAVALVSAIGAFAALTPRRSRPEQLADRPVIETAPAVPAVLTPPRG